MQTMEKQLTRCVHCLQPLSGAQQTSDHAPPRSWLPADRDRDLITAPACEACNKLFGKLEELLGIRLGLCLDPDDPRAGQIARSARRAIDGELGRSENDRHARARRRDQIGMLTYPPGHVSRFIMPNFGPRTPDARGVAIFPQEHADIAKKMVRVLTHHMFEEYIETTTHQIRTCVSFTDEQLLAGLRVLGPALKEEQHAEGTWSRVWEHNGVRIWIFRMWGKLNLAAVAGRIDKVEGGDWSWMEVAPPGRITEVCLPHLPRRGPT